MPGSISSVRKPGPDAMLPLGSSIDVWITMDSTKIPVSDTLTMNTDEEKELPDF